MSVALELQGVYVRYGHIQVVNGVDFQVRAGQIHGLIGHNGAGKSTLAGVIGGSVAPSRGEVRLDGRAVAFHSPRAAERAGVYVVRQERQIFDDLSVSDNVVAGRYPARRFGPVQVADRRRARHIATEIMADLDPGLDVRRPARGATLAQCKLIQVARAMYSRARILIFDEPTAGLSQNDAAVILNAIEAYAADGAAIVFVTHKLHEIMQIASDVSVMRDGRIVYHQRRAETTLSDIVGAVANQERRESAVRASGPDPSESGTDASRPGGAHEGATEIGRRLRLEAGAATGLDRTSMEFRSGEVVLLTGTDDSGARTVGRILAGLQGLTEGGVFVGGRTVPAGRRAAFARAGVGYAPEDRKMTGIFPDLSVEMNIALGRIGSASRYGIVRRAHLRSRVRRIIRALDIRPGDPTMPAGQLSGGNQQKVLVARWLFAEARSLVLEEPTHGVDIGAIAAMHELVRDFADRGGTAVVVSREAAEFLALADRSAVFWHGGLVKTFARGAAESDIEMAAAGRWSA